MEHVKEKGPKTQASEYQGIGQQKSSKVSQGNEEAAVEPWFPDQQDAIDANEQSLAEHGQGNHQLLRPEVLEGALGRSRNYWDYEQNLPKAAAALGHGVSQAQAFEDGNKRTAYHLTRIFLDQNGLGHVSPLDHDDEELADHLIGYGEHTHNLEDTAAMLGNRSGKVSRWSIVSAQTEDAWTHDYVKDVLDRPCNKPDHVRKIGATTVIWEELDPKVAAIRSHGGTDDDRHLAERILATTLDRLGYEFAEFTFDIDKTSRLRRTANWDDIMAKAKRLIQSGNVTILRNGTNNIVAHVIGDHGEYNSEIGREDPNSRAITQWTCDCPWNQFAWQRTRQWKKYEGRPCAHVLAAYWQAQSTPLDPDAAGQPPTPGQRGPVPQVPADIGKPGEQMKLPVTTPGPAEMPAQTQQQPMAPGQPDVLPPPPGEQMQLIPPGTIPQGQPAPPGSTVSVPGARPQTPFNPMQQNHTYSSAKDYMNGDMVRLEEATYGIMEGKSDAHGNGAYKEIPENSIGEVMGQDPTTGWVDVIFAGPQQNAGPLEPYHVRAWLEPGNLSPAPTVKKPGPFIRRR